jgi:hypothetical protein
MGHEKTLCTDGKFSPVSSFLERLMAFIEMILNSLCQIWLYEPQRTTVHFIELILVMNGHMHGVL